MDYPSVVPLFGTTEHRRRGLELVKQFKRRDTPKLSLALIQADSPLAAEGLNLKTGNTHQG